MKSVHNGKLRQVSASQIQKFDPSQQGGCNRRWYFDKVLGLSEPTTKSQATGTSIHGEIEHYLKTGENVLGKVALAGLQFIPESTEFSRQCLEVEIDLTNKEICEVPLTGRIDLLSTGSVWIDEDGLVQEQANDECEIIDWKTTSNLTYAKSGQELFDTVQMPLYAACIAQDQPGLQAIRLSHVYFQTRGAAKAKKATALFSIDKIRERYNAIGQVVESMKEAARLTDVRELPANLDACMSFGRRCTYWDNCPRAQQDVFDLYFGATTTTGDNMGLFDKPLAKKTEQQHKNGAATMPLQELALMPDAKAQLIAEERRALESFGVSIVPPDAKPSEGPGTYEPEPVKGNANQGVLALPQGFTKPTKPAQPKEAVFIAPDITKAEQAQVEAATPSPSTLELFVNVYVRGAEVQDLQVIINKCVSDIETQYGVLDIRLGKELLAYGGWKGVLAAALRDYNLSGRWVVNGTGDFIAVAVEALERQASLVVKGV